VKKFIIFITFLMVTMNFTFVVDAEQVPVTHVANEQSEFVKSRNSIIKDVLKQNEQKVVLIYTLDKNDEEYVGSGIVIGDNLILTNYHVIEDMIAAIVETTESKRFRTLGVVDYDEDADLAIIKTSEKINIHPVTFAKQKIEKGDYLVSITCPEGILNMVSDGLVSHYFTDENGVKKIITSAPVTYGSSGGALFNDKGEVIGVVKGGLEDGSLGINFAISTESVLPWLKSIKDNNKLRIKFQ
jgi:serine protease Do